MKKLLILIVVVLLASLMLPATAQAAGVFYCSALEDGGGNGTWANPWGCSTEDQLNNIIDDVICQQYYGGFLFRIYADAYQVYRITWVGVRQACTVDISQRYPGYPPNTGPENFPVPLVLGGVGIVAVGLLAGGLVLRRKRFA